MTVLQQFLFRFRDEDSNPRDLQIKAGSDGGYALSVRDKSELTASPSSASSVASGDTVDVYSQISAGEYISSIYINGTTDGLFRVFVGGALIAAKRIDIFNKDYTIQLGKLIYVSSGSLVEITVQNYGMVTGDYEIILYTEE